MKKETRVNHPPAVELAPDNRPLVQPIYQSVKFEFDSLEETLRAFRHQREGFAYSRDSNPTTRQLELLLAELQGRDDGLVTASGVSAIAETLLALTKQGDHVLCFVQTYGPSRYLIRRLLGRFGVTHTMLSIDDVAGIERELAARPTRLVFFETPTNPVTRIADLEAITRLARRHGALTVLDNTFAGFHQHGEYDVDVFVHSLTKYASGAGDVMGGAVLARAELVESMRQDFKSIGGILDPHAAYLVMRGMKTYFVRYREQTQRAQRIAELLESHPAVERVHYPGLPSHPQHALAQAQMKDFGTIVSFDLKAGAPASATFAESLQLFAMTASLGSTESLVMPSQLMGGRDLTPEQIAVSGVGPGTVRMSVGLEDPDDLLADVRQALEAVA